MRNALTKCRDALHRVQDKLIRFAYTAEGEPLAWRLAWWAASAGVIALLAGGLATLSARLLVAALWSMLAAGFYDRWLMEELGVHMMPVMSRVATLVVSMVAGLAIVCILQWVL